MEQFDIREFDVAVGSKESLISDTDIFNSIRPPTSRRHQYHKKFIGVIVFACFMLAAANFVNYEAMTRSSAYLHQIDIAQKRYTPLTKTRTEMKEGRHTRTRPRHRAKRENKEILFVFARSKVKLLCAEETHRQSQTNKALNRENIEGPKTRHCQCDKRRVTIHDNKQYIKCLCEEERTKI